MDKWEVFMVFKDKLKSSNDKRMSVPTKANINKLDNPARPKTNHQAGTELGV